jgi:hypothetical protein
MAIFRKHARSEQPQNGNNSDSQEGDTEKSGGPPQPVGFFDPSLSAVRKEVVWKWCLTTVVLMIFILGVLSIC